MNEEQKKNWIKRLKPFYETRNKEQRLNKHLKQIIKDDNGLTQGEIYSRLIYSLCIKEGMDEDLDNNWPPAFNEDGSEVIG
jgi:hypothetical protein|tara:strand:+ start:932 stop:1174 length:243 start_codon:yes stop_codon:yes gene_type:complete